MAAEPLLCLVTDRRRLIAAGVKADVWEEALTRQVAGAIRGGVTFVQIRERDLEAGALLRVTRTLVGLASGSKTRILVNDRLDVALAGGAHGVHLRSDSPKPSRIRILTPPGFLIGQAVHTVADVRLGEGSNFFVAGTMFPTASKADKQEWQGVLGMAAMVGAAGQVPVLAIGGIDGTTVHEVARSGAGGLASIGAFVPHDGQDIGQYAEEQVIRLREAFWAAARKL